jgi:hypothetical protein
MLRCCVVLVEIKDKSVFQNGNEIISAENAGKSTWSPHGKRRRAQDWHSSKAAHMTAT